MQWRWFCGLRKARPPARGKRVFAPRVQKFSMWVNHHDHRRHFTRFFPRFGALTCVNRAVGINVHGGHHTPLQAWRKLGPIFHQLIIPSAARTCEGGMVATPASAANSAVTARNCLFDLRCTKTPVIVLLIETVRRLSPAVAGRGEEPYQDNFSATWICREVVVVEVITPAPSTGFPR
jgi:hypothetical protein